MPPISADTVLVIIPILNEEASIVAVIQALQVLGLRHIVVVENGSDDDGPGLAVRAVECGLTRQELPVAYAGAGGGADGYF